MSTQNHIAQRHGRDRWKDALFIGVAVLIAGLAIGSVTTKAQPKPPEWGLTVLEQPSRLDPTIQNPTPGTPDTPDTQEQTP